MKNDRIQLLDALRGLSIILVVAYHCGYNLVVMGYIPAATLVNPLLNVLQPLFAGLFIVLAGISSRFSQNNIKRGLFVLGAAALVTSASLLVSYITQTQTAIWFGILHLMAVCILLYAVLERFKLVIPIVLLTAFFTSYYRIYALPAVPSADYFPFVPWGFLFFFGVLLGDPIRERRFPRWFYAFRMPFLPAVGRRTLLIYLLHQPALYGIIWVVSQFTVDG